jgi:mRNA interferase MazF
MTATIKPTIAISQALFDQAEIVAKQLNLLPNELFEIAIEHFVRDHQSHASLNRVNQTSDAHPVDGEPIINQGNVYWIRPENPDEAELGYYSHPYVVVQDNLFNYSRIHSVVVCALTTNLKQANAPGNVLLEVGEANLPKQSAVVVSKVSAVHKSQLGDYIGSLSERRIKQILAGMQFLQSSFFAH